MVSSGRILGIDYGSKRIGIALSDPMNIIAKGLHVVPNSPDAPRAIAKVAAQYEVKLIVVGMPFNLKGDVGQKGIEVRTFEKNLEKETSVDIVEWDERFTSRTAQETLRTMGVKKSQRQSKESIDTMAAAIILQGYLDRQQELLSRTEV